MCFRQAYLPYFLYEAAAFSFLKTLLPLHIFLLLSLCFLNRILNGFTQNKNGKTF